MRTILRLGRRYFGIHPLVVAAYILAALLCQPILSVAVTLKLSQLTNYFQGAGQAAESGAGNAGAAEVNKAPPALAPAPPSSVPTPQISKAELGPVYLTWLGLTIAVIACTFGQKYITAYLSTVVANEIRRDAFDAALKQSPRFFFEYNADRLTAIINQFCNVVQLGLRQLLIDPALQVINFIVVGCALYFQIVSSQKGGGGHTWLILGLIAAVALVYPFLVARMARSLERDVEAVQNQNIAISTLVAGALKAVEEIQAMRAEPIFRAKQADFIKASLDLTLRQTVTVEKLNVLNRSPGDIVLILLLGFAVWAVLAGNGGSPGTIVSLALLTPQFMGAVQGLAGYTINKSMSAPAISLVGKILESKPDVDVRPGARDFDELESRIEVRNLVFSYRPGVQRNVLDGISFSLPPGKITGFVARPGQGKTTFFRLALRFYDSQAGEIVLGGQPATAFTLNSLRKHIVLMPQFPAFFYGTIRENFLIAKPTATDEEIRALARETKIWPVLERSFRTDTLGLDPLDVEFAGGGPLSGGEKKLFALTRCLLREPTFLFLDEPTSNMGPIEKFPLIDVMKSACVGKTVVVVDHDIVWQSLFCDHILVLNEGKIVQEGTPGALRSEPGLFRDLFDKACQGCIHPKLAPARSAA